LKYDFYLEGGAVGVKEEKIIEYVPEFLVEL